jgi:LPS-assembly protein
MKRFLLIIFTFYSICSQANELVSQDKSYVIEADVVEYDQDKNIVSAKGNIEIVRDEYTLKANKVSYNENTKKAFASGNVVLLSNSGDVITADEVEIDNTLKEAIAEFAKATIDRDNKFTAKRVRSHYPNIIVFEDVTYTPCEICQDKSPQWQIKSSRIHYEKKSHTSYLNNVFEIHGIPVFYLPYFMTASPDSPPRSGLLFPNRQTYNDNYGYGITIPLYLRVADNKDLLYSPVVTAKQGLIHQATFKHLLENGNYSIGGNYLRTIDQRSPLDPVDRFHALAEGNYKLNERWHLAGKLDRVSDKSYLHNYWEESPNYLATNASLYYLNGHNFGSLESYGFQGLRAGDSITTDPKLLPLLDYHHEVNSPIGILSLDTNMVNIERNTGVNSKRISGQIGLDKTYYFKYQELSVLPKFKVDLYNFQHKAAASLDSAVTNNAKNTARTIPELELVWKMPFVSDSLSENSIYIEPIIDLILSPNNSKNSDIINEDSQEVELTDTNLFSTNRYSGFDRVEQGLRTNYGLRVSGIIGKDKEYNILVGQSYKVKKDPDYYVNSGLWNKYFSDVVSRFGIKPHKTTELYYRNRVDSKDATVRRHEFGLDFNFEPARILEKVFLNLNYIDYDFLVPLPNQATQSTGITSRFHVNKEWYFGGELRRGANLTNSFPVSARFNLGYLGECTELRISAFKDYTKDPTRNLRPTKGFVVDLDVHLKNISN